MTIPKRVLVIEDNSDNSRLAEKILTKFGFECYLCATAVEGIKAITSYHPHIILLDMSLPGMDGWQAAQLIKSNKAIAHIPVIALTAHAMLEDRQRAAQAGCEGFVAKPYRSAELIEAIQKLLVEEPTIEEPCLAS